MPKWLRFGGEYRVRFEGFSGGGFQEDREDLYVLNRFRINMRIEPTPLVKFVFQGQDARVFGNRHVPKAPPYHDSMDLRLGFVEFGDTQARSAGLRIGRQELAFGDQRLIGGLPWTNTTRTFDAVCATVRRRGYRLDAFAASVVNLRHGEFNKRRDGDNLHGLYGGIEKLVPNATLEPYVLWRVGQGLSFRTFGLRAAGKFASALDYGIEVAGQTGHARSEDVRAWAGHWLLGYTAGEVRVFAEYNHASGDRDPGDGWRGTFDQLYPTGHDKYGLSDQVGWRNIHHARSGVEWKLQPKWLLSSSYHSWWLDSSGDGLYSASGALIVRPAGEAAGRHVGQEIDLQAAYSVSKQAQIAFGFAHIFPGQFLRRATPGRSYSFPYMMASYSF